MSTVPAPTPHVWYTPADIAAWLDATPHGSRWRARCPVHGGDNATALSIGQGRDRDGNPMTLLHCFAHGCAVEDLCAALGIAVKHLFCVHPTYAQSTRYAPRSRSPRIAQLRTREQAASPDDIAEILLEEMIVSDPQWIQACAPARAKMWALAQASPRARARLSQALRTGGMHPARFWETLRVEQEGQSWS